MGSHLVWESYKLDAYVQEQIERDVLALETCHYSIANFREILNKIQKAVDDLSLNAYSNLPQWVHRLDEEVEKQWAGRLEAGLVAWKGGGGGVDDKSGGADEDDDENDAGTGAKIVKAKPGGDPQIKGLVHEMRISNQVLY